MVNTGCIAEERKGCVSAHESVPSQRRELADRHTISSHHVRFAEVQSAHDLATVIAKLSLGDLSRHLPIVALSATGF